MFICSTIKGGKLERALPTLPNRSSLLLELINKEKYKMPREKGLKFLLSGPVLGPSGYLAFGRAAKPNYSEFVLFCFSQAVLSIKVKPFKP